MAGFIPQSFIDDLLARADIVDVIGAKVTLKKTGKNYSGLCPFHQEKSPSFTVEPAKQFYYCFGCGKGGNAVGFVMDFENIDYPQAIELLASSMGLEVPREESSEVKQQRERNIDLYDVLQQAAAYYQQQLRQHPADRKAQPRAAKFARRALLALFELVEHARNLIVRNATPCIRDAKLQRIPPAAA